MLCRTRGLGRDKQLQPLEIDCTIRERRWRSPLLRAGDFSVGVRGWLGRGIHADQSVRGSPGGPQSQVPLWWALDGVRLALCGGGWRGKMPGLGRLLVFARYVKYGSLWGRILESSWPSSLSHEAATANWPMKDPESPLSLPGGERIGFGMMESLLLLGMLPNHALFVVDHCVKTCRVRKFRRGYRERLS